MRRSKSRYAGARVASLMMALILAACQTGQGSPSAGGSEAGSDSGLKLAFVVWNLDGYRQQADVAAFRAQAESQGDEALIFDSQNDAGTQTTQVDQLITQQVDAVALWPVDSASACTLVNSLEEAGIAVVAYNDAIPDCPEVDYLISRDNYQVGVELAENALATAGGGNYVLVGGDEAHTVGREFHRGWTDALAPAVASGEVTIVSDQFNKDWDPAAGLTQVEQALTANENDVTAIIAGYDGYIIPILGALEAQDLAGEVWVGGHDADLPVVREILAGRAHYSGWTPTSEMGAAAASSLRVLASGNDLPEGTIDIDVGGQTVKGQTFLSFGVTQDNLADWLCREEYYQVEEVYEGIEPESDWPTC